MRLVFLAIVIVRKILLVRESNLKCFFDARRSLHIKTVMRPLKAFSHVPRNYIWTYLVLSWLTNMAYSGTFRWCRNSIVSARVKALWANVGDLVCTLPCLFMYFFSNLVLMLGTSTQTMNDLSADDISAQQKRKKISANKVNSHLNLSYPKYWFFMQQ